MRLIDKIKLCIRDIDNIDVIEKKARIYDSMRHDIKEHKNSYFDYYASYQKNDDLIHFRVYSHLQKKLEAYEKSYGL